MDDHTDESNEDHSDHSPAVSDESSHQDQQHKEPQTEQSLLEDEADPEQAREEIHAKQEWEHHGEHGDPGEEHDGHGEMHEGPEQMFRPAIFFISTLLLIPVLLYSKMPQKWLGLARQGPTDPLSLLPVVSVSEVRHFSVTEIKILGGERK